MRIPTPVKPVRQLLLSLSLAAAASLALAEAQQIQGQPTTLASTADRMISYRCQNHMWQTADGATHAIINRGPGLSGQSLTLFSTFDGGATWINSGVSLPSSNGSSTSDGYLSGNRLRMTYDVGTSAIRYAEVNYDPAARTWKLGQVQVVYNSDSAAALTPSMAADAKGRQWLAFTSQDKATGNFSIKLMLRVSKTDAWVDTGFVFGSVDNLSNERSGRPIATKGGMGMVFTVKSETYWAERKNSWDPAQPWKQSLVYTKEVPMNDPYGTHFSVVADAAYNMHMVQVDGGRMVYSRYLVADKAWQTSILTDNQKTSYVQATIADGNVVLVGNSYTNLSVYQSTDGGETFTRTQALTHPAPTGGIDYSRPRMETPATSTSPIPVLQQYLDGKIQRAMFFAVPTVAP